MTPTPDHAPLTAEEECQHEDENAGPGTAIMLVSPGRYECAVCGERFRMIRAKDLARATLDAARIPSQPNPTAAHLRDVETFISGEADNGRVERRIANAVINKVESAARLLDARTPPQPDLREALRARSEQLHDREFWGSDRTEHTKEWADCTAYPCAEDRAALASQPTPASVRDPEWLDVEQYVVTEKLLRDAWLRMDAVRDPKTAHVLWKHIGNAALASQGRPCRRGVRP